MVIEDQQEKEKHKDNFKRIFELYYKEILKNTIFKSKLSSTEVREYIHDAYISIYNTMDRAKKEYDNLITDKDYLKYMYYSINSMISNDGKKNNKISFVTDEIDDDKLKAEKEEMIGLDLFYQDALIELEKILTPFELSIWKPIHLYNFSIHKLNRATSISHRTLKRVLENCKIKMEANKEIFEKLENLYINDNDLFQDDYDDMKKKNITNSNLDSEV